MRHTDWEAGARDAKAPVELWALDALAYALMGDIEKAKGLIALYDGAPWYHNANDPGERPARGSYHGERAS